MPAKSFKTAEKSLRIFSCLFCLSPFASEHSTFNESTPIKYNEKKERREKKCFAQKRKQNSNNVQGPSESLFLAYYLYVYALDLHGLQFYSRAQPK